MKTSAIRIALAVLCLMLFASCDSLDEQFEELNVNPTQANQVDPNFKLTTIQVNISGQRYENWRTNLIYSSVMIQHFATLPGYWAGAAMQQINEQIWAATLLNEYEGYANWRRTGYPELTPVVYPGNVTGGAIPRRLRYREAEAVANPESYQAAISRQGPDEFTTRMWWDR